ncbi:1886_t:CDS:2 [Acaulospora morrowiae]|uniref:1886_t:CDS:1 n=1 Tax=Acaulospora morrowiae TaxID=94023 RepID=A0A9N9DHD9_9GLOM|nr:1886_t:CDS:2 [Acaulospora morrowiae]
MSKAQIDLANLDFSHTYSIEEFELINEKLKTCTLEVNGQPKPCSNATGHSLHGGEIVRQLGNWNIQTRQNGDVKTAQGGFNFSVGGQRTIRAPDVSFTPKAVSRRLTELQRWNFQGQPFTPTFVVEVGDTQSSTSAFWELDDKFKREYFAVGTSVQLGWLIDPKIEESGYTSGINMAMSIVVRMIEEAILQESSETSSVNEELQIDCPLCGTTFSDHYTFTKHYTNEHARKRRRTK